MPEAEDVDLKQLSRLAMSTWNDLLTEWVKRPPMARYVAGHPKTVREVVSDLDARGETAAANTIHSLVFELALMRSRAIRDVIADIELGIMDRDGLLG